MSTCFLFFPTGVNLLCLALCMSSWSLEVSATWSLDPKWTCGCRWSCGLWVSPSSGNDWHTWTTNMMEHLELPSGHLLMWPHEHWSQQTDHMICSLWHVSQQWRIKCPVSKVTKWGTVQAVRTCPLEVVGWRNVTGCWGLPVSCLAWSCDSCRWLFLMLFLVLKMFLQVMENLGTLSTTYQPATGRSRPFQTRFNHSSS